MKIQFSSDLVSNTVLGSGAVLVIIGVAMLNHAAAVILAGVVLVLVGIGISK